MSRIPRRVFLSYTRELQQWPEDRSFVAAAESALGRSGNAVVDMRYFTALDQRTTEACRSSVLDADIYVGLIGFQYGSLVRDRPDVSYLELEFETATEAGMPRLVFLLDENALVPYRVAHDPEFGSRQMQFRARLEDGGLTTARFSSAQELETKLLQALYELSVSDVTGAAARPPWMAPRLGPKVVMRPAVTAALAAAVTARNRRAVGITTALTGAGGFGKTTLAALLCDDPAVRPGFAGGLLWVTVGQAVSGVNLASKVNDLCEVLSGQRPTLADPDVAGLRLGELLTDRQPLLMVIDDVWESSQLRPFMQGGERCTRLITTRVRGVLPDDAVLVQVDEMQPDEARVLLTLGLVGLSDDGVDRLLRLTGRWPVLLALVNSAIHRMVRGGASATEASTLIGDRLQAEGPAAVDIRHGGQRAQAVAATVAASLDLLSPLELDRYLDLGIFGEDVDIPASVLAMLWRLEVTAHGTAEADLFCEDLADLSLVSGYRTAPTTVRLHGVIRSYLRRQLGQAGVAARNQALLAAAAALTKREPATDATVAWWSLPTEALYLWQHLPTHLIEAGRGDELTRLVTDLRWITAKLELFGPVRVQADLGRATGSLAAELRDAVGHAAHLLAPVGPRHGVTDTLLSRLDSVPALAGPLASFAATLQRARLSVRWPLPDHAELTEAPVRGESGRVNGFAVAPTGAWLAAVSDDRRVRIWEPATWTLVRVLEGHTGWVMACAAAPDGSWLATASNDRTVRIWDPSTGTELAVLRGHTGGVRACAVAPDGSWLVTGSADRTVRVWDPVTGVLLRVLHRHDGWVNTCTVAPAGSSLITAGDDRTVCVWDSRTWSVALVMAGHSGWVNTSVPAPDGSWLATADTDAISRIWDLATGSQLRVLEGHTDSVGACAVAPDGSWLATASDDGTIRVWDPATGTQLHVLEGHTDGVKACAGAPDGSWLATAGNDGSMRIWDAVSGRQLRVLKGPSRSVNACAVAPDGFWLATAPNDGTVRIWDAVHRRQLGVLECRQGWVRGCAVAPDSSWLATAGNDGTIKIWDAATWRERHTFVGHQGWAKGCAVAPDGSWLATGGYDGMARIWDIATGRQLRVLDCGDGWIHACAVAPNATWLAVAPNDGTVCLWEPLSGRQLQVLRGHGGWVRDCAVSPNGSWLATAGYDETVRIWDPFTGRELRVLEGHSDGVRACAIAPNGRWLVTGGDDATVRIWEPLSGTCVTALRLEGPVNACCWFPSGEIVCAVGVGGTYLFTFQPPAGEPANFGGQGQTT
jgi:WD40 repeat protein